MKKTAFVFILLTGVLTLSCQRESAVSVNGSGDYVSINATLEDGNATKTYLDGVQVKWERSDVIALWYGTMGTAFNAAPYYVNRINANDQRQASFNGHGLVSDDYLGVYPQSASVDCSQTGKLTVKMPTDQTGVDGSFDHNTNVAVAYSNTTTLGFRNVGGLLAFRISDDGGHIVKSVRLTGTDALSGEVEIMQETLPAVDAVTVGVNYVSIALPNAAGLTGGAEGFDTEGGSWAGEETEPGSEWDGGSGGTSDGLWYIIALPGSHTAFTLTLVDDAGQTAVASSAYAFEIVRNSNTIIADLTVPAAKWHADATVYINEVSSNQIELYNPGGCAVDLSGWLLRCGEGSWAILPGTSIAAGGFLVITAGQASCTTGPMFEMGTAGFTLSLVNGMTVDSVVVPVINGSETYGRTADGGGSWQVFSPGSIGTTNEP